MYLTTKHVFEILGENWLIAPLVADLTIRGLLEFVYAGLWECLIRFSSGDVSFGFSSDF